MHYKRASKEIEGQFICLREITKTYKTFLVLIEHEVKRIGKNGEEVTKIISFKLKCIDNARFMACSLSNLVNNLTEVILKIKRKYRHDNKKSSKRVKLNANIGSAVLDTQTLKMVSYYTNIYTVAGITKNSLKKT